MPVLRLHDAVVTIQYVHETVTKGGLRRFEIGATRTDVSDDTLAETRVSFTTLDQFKASLCKQAKDLGFPLHVKYRETVWFDAALLFVEMVKEEPPDPGGDPERDREAQAALEYWQKGPR